MPWGARATHLPQVCAYPPTSGVRLLLNWAAGRDGARWHGDVLVTENGWGCNSDGAAAAAHDAQQQEYLSNYTEQADLAHKIQCARLLACLPACLPTL